MTLLNRRTAALAEDLRRRCFAGPMSGALRLGAEVEFLPIARATGRVCPVYGRSPVSTLRLLRGMSAEEGWRETRSGKGGPRFCIPGGGALSFEPGGQLEFASSPCPSASELIEQLQRMASTLRRSANRAGIDLLSAGIDPRTPLDCAPLQLRSPRYLTMDRHFAARGRFGRRMMRQTAALQLNVDITGPPLRAWKVANALAPYLIAVFANSPCAEGRRTPHRSFRAHCWRRLDPTRTGLAWSPGDPVAGYLRFALAACSLAPRARRRRVVGEILRKAPVTETAWTAHLSTLFPEVRPRGYLELRSPDAIDPSHYPAAIVLVSGILQHPRSLHQAEEVLGEPDPDLLLRAGRFGLREATLARGASDLVAIALSGCARLGPRFLKPEQREAAVRFFERWTLRGRCPADEVNGAGPSAPGSRSPVGGGLHAPRHPDRDRPPG